MQGNRHHKIRTQRVEVAFENPDDAFECKNHLVEVCKSRLLPAMEKLFDEKVGQKKIISIDKLYVDTGRLIKEGWETRFVEAVIHQISKYLDEEVLQEKSSTHNKDEVVYTEEFDETNGLVKGVAINTQEEGNEPEVLLHFLQHGVLPWYADIKNKEALRQQFTFWMAIADFKQRVRALIMADETTFERLVYHATEDSIFTLIEDDVKWAKIREFKKSWDRIFTLLNLTPSEQKYLFFKAVYQVLVKKTKSKADAESITLKIVTLLPKVERAQWIELIENTRAHILAHEEAKIIRSITQIITLWQKDIHKKDDSGKEIKSDKKSDNVAFDEENPVFITNAGMVLLHPFLSGLFENVGYTEKNQWISEGLQQRSLLLTQYLITGSDEYPEFDLFLNKILTGYPLEASLPVDIELSIFEKAEASDLLQSVISHWKALKNTSVQGLQNTFLQREGKIVKKGSGWLLQVEQKAFDILLDKIPWGFSTIKTPWMDEIISVEWA